MENSVSQNFPAPPALEFAMTIAINLGNVYWVRPTQYGSERAAVYLLNGTVEGPGIKGIVVPNSGGDFPWMRPDGVIVFTHLWWTAEGPDEDPYSVDQEALHRNRERVLALPGLARIFPGHGAAFVPNERTPR